MPEITCKTKGCPAYGKAFAIMAGTLECGLYGYAPHDLKPSITEVACPPPGVVACTVGDAPPHLWTCPGCNRTWHHHHSERPGVQCVTCKFGLGAWVKREPAMGGGEL